MIKFQFTRLYYLSVKVTMFEAQDRTGGRIYTHYGKGWFGDLGAMRFPDWQYLIFGVRLST